MQFTIVGLWVCLLLTSCAGPSNKTYILIQEKDQIQEYGKFKYGVDKGDVLEVVRSKICRGGVGTCFEVLNVKTNEYGYVTKSRMNRRHLIVTDVEIHNTNKDILLEMDAQDAAGGTLKGAKFYLNLGNSYLRRGEYKRAAEEYTKGIRADAALAILYVNRGVALEKTNKVDQACTDWLNACELGECSMLMVAGNRGLCRE